MTTPSVRESILVVAALARELGPLRREHPAELGFLETGEGIRNAERNLEAWLEQRGARAVLSIGFAGALSASLGIGELVVARAIHGANAAPDQKLLAAAAQVRLDAPLHFATALTSARILWQASEKRALASSLDPGEIGFVDMESAAIAGVCARHGVPFLIARSISDLLDEDLPIDFNQCRDQEGRVSGTKVMKAALFRPGSFSGLLELRKRSELCAERIADFVRKFVEVIG